MEVSKRIRTLGVALGAAVLLACFLVFSPASASPASAPSLHSPENNTVTLNPMPTFEWVRVDGAEGYRLVVDNTPDFSGDNVIDVTLESTENSYTVPFENRLSQDNYYWKVASIEGGSENWSVVRRLEVLEENTLRVYVKEATWIERFDGPNLVTNESFENGTNEDADNWAESGAAQRQSWANHTGSWGMAMCSWVNGGTGEAYQQISVSGGKEYIYKVWACRDSGDLTGSFYMKLAWYKDGGATFIGENVQGITLTTTWEEKVLIAFAPEDADTVRVTIGSSSVNRTGKFDDVTFKTGSGNHNDDWRLGVSGVSNYERYSYLKFDITELPENHWIKSARLWAYYSYGGSSGDNIAVHGQENDNWTDGTLTWNNAPSPRYEGYISENYVPAASGWVSWNVRSWVDEQYREDGIVSIVIITSNASEFWLVSDNDGEHPYLEITYKYLSAPILVAPENGTETSKTPTFVWTPSVNMDNHRFLIDNDPDFSTPVENILLGPLSNSYTIPIEDNLPLGTYYWKVVGIRGDMEMESSTATFTVAGILAENLYPTDDAYGESGNPTSNYGSDWRIGVSNIWSWRRHGYLKFDLSDLPPDHQVIEAKLYLYDSYPNVKGSRAYVAKVENDSWGESELTWANRPQIGSAISSVVMPDNGSWVSWDITEWVDDQYKGDRVVSVALGMEEFLETYFVSKEGSERPRLEVKYAWVGQPGLIAPENSSYTHDNTPTFSWRCGDNADNHRLLIDNDEDFSSPVSVILGPADNSYTLPAGSALQFGHRYYWKVTAGRDDVEIDSEVRSFLLSAAPISLCVNGIAENSSKVVDPTPTFSWEPGPFASGHRLVVSRMASNFAENVIDVVLGATDNTYTVPAENHLGPDNYLWKVGAFGSPENWSEPLAFEVITGGSETLSMMEDVHALRAAGWESFDGNQDYLYTGSWNDGLIFLKFDLSRLPQGGVLDLARLQLYCAELVGSGRVIAYALENDNWSESTVNRNSYPQSLGGSLSIATLTGTGWAYWDITGWADSQYRGDSVVSVVLAYQGVDNPKSAKFWSREYIDNTLRPRLQLTYSTVGQPVLTSPADGGTTSQTPSFSWVPAAGASSHRLLVSADSGFSAVVLDVTLGPSASGYSVPQENSLQQGARYYWKVVSSRDGVERSSAVWSFTVAAPSPAPVWYRLVTSVVPQGAGTVTPSSGTYPGGTTVSLTAEPSPGYVFQGWGGDLAGTESTATLVMDSDKEVIAYFQAQQLAPEIPRPVGDQTGQLGVVLAAGALGLSVIVIIKISVSRGKIK